MNTITQSHLEKIAQVRSKGANNLAAFFLLSPITGRG
jgi:hypothetical protein